LRGSGDLISAALSPGLCAMLGWSQTMTLEQFQEVNARLREYFDPVELPEWWGSRQPLLDGRFAIDCSYHEVMRLIDLSRFTPGLSLRSRHLKRVDNFHDGFLASNPAPPRSYHLIVRSRTTRSKLSL
jgi:hypothetical protein